MTLAKALAFVVMEIGGMRVFGDPLRCFECVKRACRWSAWLYLYRMSIITAVNGLHGFVALELEKEVFFSVVILQLPTRPCIIYLWQTGRIATSRIYTWLHQVDGLQFLHIKVDGEILRQASQ